MFELGQPVVVRCDDGLQIGEIVGEWGSAGARFYDVSLLQAVEKALPQSDIRLATPEEINGLMTSLMTARVVAPTERDALLRRQYTLFLAKALAKMKDGAGAGESALAARFALGAMVALRADDAIVLGVVKGCSTRNARTHYVVEALGEEQMVPEDRLEELRTVENSEGDGGICLGRRVRFVADGHEDDDDFLGIVCSISPSAGGERYAILFDDGDVLEDLSSSDLRMA